MNVAGVKEFSEELQEKMKEDLTTINNENREEISKISKSYEVTKAALFKLREYVYKHEFRNQQDEIQFFKEVKPVFSSQYYYYDKLFTLKLSEPLDSSDQLKSYYGKELVRMQEFIASNQEFYRYCLSGASNLDIKYFSRAEAAVQNPDLDTIFSTGYDTILGMILATRLIMTYLGKRQQVEIDGDIHSTLTWSGSKTDLVELLYALQNVNVFNNGTADVKLIATSFERMFNVKLGNFYKTYQEISIRKGVQTQFLDKLKRGFIEKLDNP